MRGGRREAFNVIVAFLAIVALAGTASPARAQGEVEERVYTVALFAPDINFSDAISKAGFVNAVASALSSRTGLKWRGQSFGQAGDFSAAARSGGVDYAIIGGTYCASSCVGTPVAFASGQGAMSVVGRGAESVAAMRGRTLILPQPSKAYEGFVSATLLGHQVEASEFFVIKTTGDARSALAAVQIGQADLTVAFDAYAVGLGVLYKTSASPLPVVTQVNQALDPELAARIASAFRGVGVQGGGIITGFGGSGEGLQAFRGFAFSKAPALRPSMASARPLRLRFPVISAAGLDRLSDARQETLIPTPELREEAP